MHDKDLLKIINETTRKATSLAFKRKFKESIAEYKRALSFLNEPILDSEFALMIFAGIGEVYFLQKDWLQALEYYGCAIRSNGGTGDPALHLRLGQIRFELEQYDKAKDELMRAYMGSGDLIFEGQDVKYYNLIKSIIEKD